MTAAAPAPRISAEPRILVEDVSICYRLAKQRIRSFKEFTIHWMRGTLEYEDLWALREVSLNIGPGEAVGLIGPNGAGKSSLLKVMAGVLEPVRGRVVVAGSLAPILELGAGFDAELTGLENLHMNALILGHPRREIERKADAIVEFSGLGDFIRSPLRNYSSGMVARLGFAVATAWAPDVLLLDEVLSVGDAAFQRQCDERLAELRERGTTFVIVSHSPSSVRELCDRCIWIEHGQVQGDGEADAVLDAYLERAVGAGGPGDEPPAAAPETASP